MAGVIAAGLVPGQALAAQLRASAATARDCQARPLAAGGSVRTFEVTAGATGLVRAVMRASGDWDLAVFDARSGRFVAAAAGPGGDELAEGYALAGQRLRVQACRRPGAGARADVDVATVAAALTPGPPGPQRIVRVLTPTPSDRGRLARLGLDPAEGGRRGAVDVVVHGNTDAARLRATGLRYRVRVADLAARDRASARADRRYAAATARSSLPSARDSYRHLADYEAELRALAQAHPGLVKLIVLAHPSLEGRQVLGVEIARDVNVDRGQPVMLQLGAHHAREWPSAELPMEWARELVDGYGSDPRITRLVDATRTIVVPVVNPDGFTISREFPLDVQTSFQYKRKNCRILDGGLPGAGQCEMQANIDRGVDPNRNYGGYWGGPGASVNVADETYRGAGPFSEPEVQNVRELVSAHQVVTLITNHTYGNLVLRPPGIAAAPQPPDEALLKSLGDAMAARNGYSSQTGFQFYDASGTTEDWTYEAEGTLGYTFEHGATLFHPPFAEVVAQYAANREAFYTALEKTADASSHAIARGQAPPGTVLRAHKAFDTKTAPVLVADSGAVTAPARTFHDVLDSTMTVDGTGAFSWSLNPSTRPTATGPESWSITCERPAGTVLARGSLRIGRGETKALDVCGLNFSFAVKRRKVSTGLRLGLRARARCSTPCTSSVTLSLPAASARRYGLTKRHTGRVDVARGARKKAFMGRRTLTVRFTARARRKLRGASRLRLRVSALGRGTNGDKSRVKRTVVLKR
ncbi:MAG: carboxypeptidase [Solirubrobacteraceae bacterium]|nr:carboxypeptidase [Solirubrobacteraceae bacterium]